jgi:hypothetical protein
MSISSHVERSKVLRTDEQRAARERERERERETKKSKKYTFFFTTS